MTTSWRDPALLRQALRVYLVADPAQCQTGDLVGDVRAAIRGGVTFVQLRAKDLPDREALALGAGIRAVCGEAGVPFVTNDRVDWALALGADGVHLGLDDMPVELARRLLGGDAVIGWSPATVEESAVAAGLGYDYVGLGPVYATGSKADAGGAIGVDGLRDRAAATTLPTVGIGGISAVRASECIRAGADGVAVISAILHAPDREEAARALVATTSPTTSL